MTMQVITPVQARRYMLLAQGLLGKHRFSGKQGVRDYITQSRCVQFDPVDVCGKSPEVTLFSRVKGFRKEMLYELLYDERSLIDYFDKNLCIIPTEDYPCFTPRREEYIRRTRGKAEVDLVTDEVRRVLMERECISSQELELDGNVDWYWSRAKLSRAALETMYFRGELIIHHKKGAVKSYALPEGNIDTSVFYAPFPFDSDEQYRDFRVLRRIRNVSLMWCRASDAWLDIRDFKTQNREAAFESLQKKGEITEIRVDGQTEPFFIPTEFTPFLEAAVSCEKFRKRLCLVKNSESVQSFWLRLTVLCGIES